MSRIRIAPIVEGHGEVQCIRILLQRIWTELLKGEYADVVQPIRRPKSKLIQREGLSNAVELACLKLGPTAPSSDRSMVLILLDANSDPEPPCKLGPTLLGYAHEAVSTADIACVIANVEYESWFVAAAESLGDYLDPASADRIPGDPEHARTGKGWIEHYFNGTKYSETVDQPRMTARMDLALCRSRSGSFDKLCRELEKRLTTS